MSIGRFGYCTSLLKRRQRYAIHCNFRNLGGESNGRKEGRSASGVLKYEVLKGDLKEGEDETKVYSSSDFQDHRGMQLVFLGTSSAVPTITRNTSCIAVRLAHDGCAKPGCKAGVAKHLTNKDKDANMAVVQDQPEAAIRPSYWLKLGQIRLSVTLSICVGLVTMRLSTSKHLVARLNWRLSTLTLWLEWCYLPTGALKFNFVDSHSFHMQDITDKNTMSGCTWCECSVNLFNRSVHILVGINYITAIYNNGIIYSRKKSSELANICWISGPRKPQEYPLRSSGKCQALLSFFYSACAAALPAPYSLSHFKIRLGSTEPASASQSAGFMFHVTGRHQAKRFCRDSINNMQIQHVQRRFQWIYLAFCALMRCTVQQSITKSVALFVENPHSVAASNSLFDNPYSLYGSLHSLEDDIGSSNNDISSWGLLMPHSKEPRGVRHTCWATKWEEIRKRQPYTKVCRQEICKGGKRKSVEALGKTGENTLV
eukprot:Gb_12439 [translate_table: standard]